jgi:predicted ATPase
MAKVTPGRATLNVIPRWQLEDGSWVEESNVFTLANARCKKENTDIIRNTFGTVFLLPCSLLLTISGTRTRTLIEYVEAVLPPRTQLMSVSVFH